MCPPPGSVGEGQVWQGGEGELGPTAGTEGGRNRRGPHLGRHQVARRGDDASAVVEDELLWGSTAGKVRPPVHSWRAPLASLADVGASPASCLDTRLGTRD